MFFPYGKHEGSPTCLLMGDTPLPWVNNWPHLGNNIHTDDFQYPGKGSLTHDLFEKRQGFIGKFHSLFQEFGFADSEIMLKMVQIYAMSFYGSQLWDYTSSAANKLFTSWNILVRTVFGVPNTTHRYLIDQLSNSQHLMVILYKRYLTFIQSILTSHKKCLASLASRMTKDQGSITKKNLNLISHESGVDEVLDVAPSFVVSTIVYAPTPIGEEWRHSLLLELIDLRKHNLELDFDDNVEFTLEEVNDMINLVASG